MEETIEERIAEIEENLLTITATLRNIVKRAEEDKTLLVNKHVELCDWIKTIERRQLQERLLKDGN